jgi:hypothetical protein
VNLQSSKVLSFEFLVLSCQSPAPLDLGFSTCFSNQLFRMTGRGGEHVPTSPVFENSKLKTQNSKLLFTHVVGTRQTVARHG